MNQKSSLREVPQFVSGVLTANSEGVAPISPLGSYLFCGVDGCGLHPAFPAPSFIKEGQTLMQTSGAIAPRDRGSLRLRLFDIRSARAGKLLHAFGGRKAPALA
jgi:hypothetical protein